MPDIVVDTSEMADSLDSVSSDVRSTSLAVLAMQQEVCEIERQSAAQIRENVNVGFFSLQHSQISQKKVMARSQAEACLLGLKQSAQALYRIKNQMTRDYQRITSRYTKLFKCLNDALKTRIYAIDKPASTVSDKEYMTISRRITNCGGPLAVVQNELLNSQIQLTVSRCKKHCLSLIDKAKTFVTYNNELQSVISGISKDEAVYTTVTKYMPVLFIASTDLNLEDSETSDIIIGEEKFQKRISVEIKRGCFELNERFVWTDSSLAERDMITDLIQKKITEKNNFDQRTKDIMLKLLGESMWQTLGGMQ